MKNKNIAWIMASVLCLAAPIGAQAPASSGHSGFHAAIGAGYGSIAFTCDVCTGKIGRASCRERVLWYV